MDVWILDILIILHVSNDNSTVVTYCKMCYNIKFNNLLQDNFLSGLMQLWTYFQDYPGEGTDKVLRFKALKCKQGRWCGEHNPD